MRRIRGESRDLYKYILIATGGSEPADGAVTAGVTLAKAVGAKATAVRLSEPWTDFIAGDAPVAFPFGEYEKSAAQAAAKILASADNQARRLEVPCVTVHLKAHVAEGILQAAEDRDCDLIVMATHGRRGLARLLLRARQCML
jgi:nucleotide-binding universal stress UspA family protein